MKDVLIIMIGNGTIVSLAFTNKRKVSNVHSRRQGCRHQRRNDRYRAGDRQRFVAEGALVFIFGRRQAQLDQAAKPIGRNVTAKSVGTRAQRSAFSLGARTGGFRRIGNFTAAFGLPMRSAIPLTS